MPKIIKIDRTILRKIERTQNPFLSLANSIIYQQISTAAGNAIYAKFLKLFGKKKITPKNFLQVSLANIKQAGISTQKYSYLKDLAEKFLNKTIGADNFDMMSDEEVKEHLMQVKGIGPWTSDMFLIFALNRVDILPVGDLGTKKGFQKAFNLKKLPTETEMHRLAKPHLGRRTELTLYLWQILEQNLTPTPLLIKARGKNAKA
jgi:DNA-3-methyladenine glycosylase II